MVGFKYKGRTFGPEEIYNASADRRNSLNLAELPANSLDLTIQPILNRSFFVRELHEESWIPMFTRSGLRFETSEENPMVEPYQQGETVEQYDDSDKTASWYLSSLKQEGLNRYRLAAQNTIGLLIKKRHYGGVYGDNPLIPDTVGAVIDDICGDIPHEVSSEFYDIPPHGWLPVASARDNLQQILFAMSASIQIDENGKLLIQSTPVTVVPTIGEERVYLQGAQDEAALPVTAVELTVHRFYGSGAEKKVYESATAVSDQLVIFNEPMRSVRASANTLTIVESGANFARVTGYGTLYGTPYIHSQLVVSESISTADTENVVKFPNATLVGVDESADVLGRLKAYYLCRNTIKASAVNESLTPGLPAVVYDAYSAEMGKACISRAVDELSVKTKTTIEALAGFEPWQRTNTDVVRVLLSPNQTYTIPQDVADGTAALLVVIGGGDGGDRGIDGEPGDGTFSDVDVKAYVDYEKALWHEGGAGGPGGPGGKAGHGGKILQTIISIQPGMVVSVSGGSGGVGGSEQTPAGAAGSATTVTIDGTTYSSDDGAEIDTGYVDYSVSPPVTFAAAGIDGSDGGDGGQGAQKTKGTAGESVDDSRGGVGGRLGKYTYEATTPDVEMFQFLGGSGGGGAAVGNNGEAADATWDVDIQPGTTGTPSLHFTFSDNGGNGADAAAPTSTAATLGSGGNGGNGGGGGGGAAGYSGRAKVNPEGAPEFWYTTDTKAGDGGKASDGTAGRNGGMLLIFRKPA